MNRQITAILTALLMLMALTGCATATVQTAQIASESASASAPADRSEMDPGSAAASDAEASAEAEGASGREAAVRRRARELLSYMTLDEKIYQLFIVTQEQLTGVGTVTKSGETTREAIERQRVGGVIYFEPNIVSPEQCSEMIENIQSYTKIGLFIAVDEEGGKVARLGNNPAMGTTAFPGGPAAIGQTGDPEAAYEAGATIGKDLARYGFNLDLAPVAEITDDVEHSVIGTRSFGTDPDLTASMVAKMVTGLHQGGVLCTLKHFPGHGDTSVDPHEGYSEMSKPLEELRAADFLPFQAGVKAGADFLMMGHFSSPQLTGDDLPATLSEKMISLAREELSFDGLVMTDSLSMGAITDRYSSAEAALLSLKAGADVILMPADLGSAVGAIRDAVEQGELSQARIDESVEKILVKKLQFGIAS